MAAPLTARRSVVVISDWVDGRHPGHDRPSPAVLPVHAVDSASQPWIGDLVPTDVTGGYLERLPLALVAAGIVDQAEIWHHWRGADEPPFRRDNAVLARRAFRIDDERAPFASSQMIAFVEAFGAPHILVVFGLGVAPDLLELCANSIILYNSIDAPSLRVPRQVSEHFDLVITGAQWQSDEVEARHPGMCTAILPVGPEFAAIDQFRPLGRPKDVDLIYVAAAQPYSRAPTSSSPAATACTKPSAAVTATSTPSPRQSTSRILPKRGPATSNPKISATFPARSSAFSASSTSAST